MIYFFCFIFFVLLHKIAFPVSSRWCQSLLGDLKGRGKENKTKISFLVSEHTHPKSLLKKLGRWAQELFLKIIKQQTLRQWDFPDLDKDKGPFGYHSQVLRHMYRFFFQSEKFFLFWLMVPCHPVWHHQCGSIVSDALALRLISPPKNHILPRGMCWNSLIILYSDLGKPAWTIGVCSC